MPHRQEHREEVRRYLQEQFRIPNWSFSLPHGSGMETYLVQGNEQNYFVKVGAPVERYLVMAEIGLTPSIITCGELVNGLSIIIQSFIEGRRPSPMDFCDQLENVAAIVQKMHRNLRLKGALEARSSNHFKDIGLQALEQLRSKWERYKAQIPRIADFVDNSLEHLARQVNRFTGDGLVASHNDICNANWLFASDGRIYIVDFESMTMDDPATDLGALLWWYYPPELRHRFLEIAGYRYDDEFRFRMQVRMAMHCLSITLPREGSFDQFNSENFSESLRDVRAVLDGKENPEGYIK